MLCSFVMAGCCSLLLSMAGCQQQTTAALLGEWVGRPNTAVARAEREAEKYGDLPSTPESTTPGNSSRDLTDWEKFDVKIGFNFLSGDTLEMSQGEGAQPLRGDWRIVAMSPTGCTIEIETEESPNSGSEAALPMKVRRRFVLELDQRDGACVGFLLTELGVDRQLGSLYFSRP